jgi:hypothetical protein
MDMSFSDTDEHGQGFCRRSFQTRTVEREGRLTSQIAVPNGAFDSPRLKRPASAQRWALRAGKSPAHGFHQAASVWFRVFPCPKMPFEKSLMNNPG